MTINTYTLTVEDVAKSTGYCIQHVRRMARNGELPAVKRGRSWRFSEEEVFKALFKTNPFGIESIV
jgi:excisionase family DNA binding protein